MTINVTPDSTIRVLRGGDAPAPEYSVATLLNAEAELAALRARVAELEAEASAAREDAAKVRRVAIRDLQREHLERTPAGTLLCYWTPETRTMVITGTPEGEDHNCDTMGCQREHVVERINVKELEARLAALEAPPVVPEGFRLERGNHGSWELHALGSLRESLCWDNPASLRALAYALETGQRPPHASDGEKTP